MKLFYSTGQFKISGDDLETAIKVGNIEVVKFFYSLGVENINQDVIHLAAKSCHLEMVKFLVGTGKYPCYPATLQVKNKEIVKWLYANCFHYLTFVSELKKYSELVNPSETVCMICHDEMNSETLVKEFKCKHFVCEECYEKVEKCCICDRKNTGSRTYFSIAPSGYPTVAVGVATGTNNSIPPNSTAIGLGSNIPAGAIGSYIIGTGLGISNSN